ncbi:V-type proton ATPase subunit S1-like protein isoform X2 [Stigmatopora argus]
MGVKTVPPWSTADPLPAEGAADCPGNDEATSADGVTAGRKLLQTAEAELPFPPLQVSSNGRPCVMFQARKLALRYERRKQVDLTERAFSPRKSVDTSQSLCRPDTATLVMQFGDVDDLRGLSIRMHLSNTFYESSGQWWFSVDSVSLLYNSSQEAVFNASDVYAPSSSSYTCSRVSSLERHSALLRPGSDPARRWTLTFTDFQIQAFNVTSGSFSPASDCAAFLTPAILMGLVTSLILLLVLAYAMHLLVHLNRIENERERKAHARFLRSHEQLEGCCAENADDKDAP